MNLKKLREQNIEETEEKLKNIPQDKLAIKLFKHKDQSYKDILENLTPELFNLLGPELTIEFISSARSLKKLAFMTSSQIQVIGAEKALFRHLKDGSKAPKYGIIFKHSTVQESDNKAKAARQLSAKISLAAKKDYFRNE